MIEGNIVGNINITVCKTKDGYEFFYFQAENTDVLPVVYTIEDILVKY